MVCDSTFCCKEGVWSCVLPGPWLKLDCLWDGLYFEPGWSIPALTLKHYGQETIVGWYPQTVAQHFLGSVCSTTKWCLKATLPMLTWTIYKSSHIHTGRLVLLLSFPTHARHWELQRLHLTWYRGIEPVSQGDSQIMGTEFLQDKPCVKATRLHPEKPCCFAVKCHGCGECEALWHQHQRALPVYCACPGGDQGFSHLIWKWKGKFCAQFWA